MSTFSQRSDVSKPSLQQSSYVRQTEMPEETLLPRWGCFFMSLLGMAQHYTQYHLNAEHCEMVYWVCREVEGWDRKMILEKRHGKLWCNDPDAALHRALQFCWRDYSAASTYMALQTGNQDGWATWVLPQHHKCNYTLVRKQTANGGHWILGDAMRNMLWDPHGGLKWTDTSTYRQFYIGRRDDK